MIFKDTDSFGRVLLVAVAAVLVTSVAATDSKDYREPWARIEEFLVDRGVDIDTDSLIREIELRSKPMLTTMAIEVLGRRQELESKPSLLKVLREAPELHVREAAAIALARLDEVAGRQALCDFMHSQEDWRRQLFLAARLAETGDQSGYPYVEAASESDDPKKRFDSLMALLDFLPPSDESVDTSTRALERFLALSVDEDLNVRLEFLAQVSIAKHQGVAEETLTLVLEKISAEDVDPKVREQASTRLRYWRFLEAEAKRREEKDVDKQ